jgi:YD repeat-containing protein
VRSGELNQATLGNLGHTLTYNLDKMGNRTSVVDNNVTSTYVPNSINQYYPTAGGSSITNGPEHEIQTYNGVTYSYINDDHLKSVTSGSTTYSMVYDALGRCITRSLTGGPTTNYIYDGEKPILEWDASGTSAGVNLYGKGVDEILERVAIGSDGLWYAYPQQNHEGSGREEGVKSKHLTFLS